MHTRFVVFAAAALASAIATAPASARQGAGQSYFRCEVGGRIANFVVAANDFRQGIPPKVGANVCAEPGATCTWANGVLTLNEQISGRPMLQTFDTVKGVYTTRYNGQDRVSTCTKETG